ncbi:YqkE family protein [Paenibacillus glycanilyticus]|uniref:YqkE family protein n=1 Tax=Paenibacillus glycanilyticus TaxID=126569 RepID=UPI00203F4717|nr:YqkE family protein [Paenibacillus glycanilyticus]MCM3630916.1 YqkE family protein [Paenibacillus glycanilyticus]
MAKKKRPAAPSHRGSTSSQQEQGPTLKDMLSADVLQKLKAQSDEMKAAEEQKKQKARVEAEEARKKEQKRLENDMNYLLENSKQDWRKYK